MKTLLILLGAGVLGLIGGGIPGYLAGQPIGVESGTIAGICSFSNTALQAKVLTPEQLEKLGTAIPTQYAANTLASHAKDRGLNNL
ncbi:MAG: hypothetical protein MUF49_23315 [Oculatellaceae cyanobacterium Prado106]|jgi:hypothetical protein|nr:hypothetical protein [Oculatellaceae cyanobacterium Prado106]